MLTIVVLAAYVPVLFLMLVEFGDGAEFRAAKIANKLFGVGLLCHTPGICDNYAAVN